MVIFSKHIKRMPFSYLYLKAYNIHVVS